MAECQILRSYKWRNYSLQTGKVGFGALTLCVWPRLQRPLDTGFRHRRVWPRQNLQTLCQTRLCAPSSRRKPFSCHFPSSNCRTYHAGIQESPAVRNLRPFFLSLQCLYVSVLGTTHDPHTIVDFLVALFRMTALLWHPFHRGGWTTNDIFSQQVLRTFDQILSVSVSSSKSQTATKSVLHQTTMYTTAAHRSTSCFQTLESQISPWSNAGSVSRTCRLGRARQRVLPGSLSNLRQAEDLRHVTHGECSYVEFYTPPSSWFFAFQRAICCIMLQQWLNDIECLQGILIKAVHCQLSSRRLGFPTVRNRRKPHFTRLDVVQPLYTTLYCYK